jgi:hypothetical protein
MAIKVLTPIHIERFNLNLSNLIISFKGAYRMNYIMNNEQKIYIVSGVACYYVDREKEPIYHENREHVINESQLSTNLLEYLYSMLKVQHTNYEDL